MIMHSYEGPSGRTYHHASEGSVNDVVHFKVPYTVERISGPREHHVDVQLTMADILFLAANLVRSQRTRVLEEGTDLEILGLDSD